MPLPEESSKVVVLGEQSSNCQNAEGWAGPPPEPPVPPNVPAAPAAPPAPDPRTTNSSARARRRGERDVHLDVMKRYTVAEARAQLTSLLNAVSRGEDVEITRRGKPVAVVRRREGGLGEAIARWRETAAPEAFIDDAWIAGLRDRRDRGRAVEL
jgi:antitoxin (DNA-binding transcriptional repressor) of toxin-antitoxin stability system